MLQLSSTSWQLETQTHDAAHPDKSEEVFKPLPCLDASTAELLHNEREQMSVLDVLALVGLPINK